MCTTSEGGRRPTGFGRVASTLLAHPRDLFFGPQRPSLVPDLAGTGSAAQPEEPSQCSISPLARLAPQPAVSRLGRLAPQPALSDFPPA